MKRLQLRKGVRYSMQVAATIAVGLATESLAFEQEDVAIQKNKLVHAVIDTINEASGIDGVNVDEKYATLLIHNAHTIRFTTVNGNVVEVEVPPALMFRLRTDNLCEKVGVANIDSCAEHSKPIQEALVELTELLASEADLEARKDRLVENVFNELQKMQSLSKILATYPDAINYMPKDMVEAVEAPALADLLKSA